MVFEFFVMGSVTDTNELFVAIVLLMISAWGDL